MIRILKRLTIVEMVVIVSIIGLCLAIAIPIVAPGPCHSPKYVRTRSRLYEIAQWMMVFHEDEKKFPDLENWKDEMAPYFLNSESENLLVDGWGNKIKYVHDGNKQRFVYSFGPNGIDEATRGDDLSYLVGFLSDEFTADQD